MEQSLNPHNVTIGFSTTTLGISKAIRIITGDSDGPSPFSHAWIERNFNENVRHIHEAEWYGVRPTYRGIWCKKNIKFLELEPIGHDMVFADNWLGQQTGKKYGWFSALLSGIWKRVGRWAKGKFDSPNEMMCSEFVIRYLNEAGFIATEPLDPEGTSPLVLAKRCLGVVSEFRIKYIHEKVLERFADLPVCVQYLRTQQNA